MKTRHKTRKRRSTKFDAPEFKAEDLKIEEPEKLSSQAFSEIECPHCGDAFEVWVDPSDDSLGKRKTCQLCAKPVMVHAEMDGEELVVNASRL